MTEIRLGRRDAIRAAGGIAAGVALGGVATPTAAQEDLSSWFVDVSNFDGVVDSTGEPEVRVGVGVEANGGAFGFGPPAVRVDPGTTVVWEWTGKGGSHNVANPNGEFESSMTDKSGHTFSHTFESDGVYRYVCTPHKSLGMKGAILVGDVDVTTDGGSEGGDDETDGSEDGTGEATATPNESEGDGSAETTVSSAVSEEESRLSTFLVGGGLLGAVVSPVLFGLFVRIAGTKDET